MSKENLTATLFKITSRITDIFPRLGAKLLNGLVFVLAGNPFFYKTAFKKNLKIIKNTKKFDRICILGDVNIGDEILTQSTVSALRNFFPESRIDCVVNTKMKSLLAENPEISGLFSIYSTPHGLTDSELGAINKLLNSSNYDLIFNLCPHISSKNVEFLKTQRAISYSGMIFFVIRTQKSPQAVNQMVYQNYKFVYNLFSETKRIKNYEFNGVKITISSEAIKQAKNIIDKLKLNNDKPKIFLNPDASSRFTRIPSDTQEFLLKEFAAMPCEVLLGSELGIVPVDVYAALIDYFDIFITGDTGPMHLAAAHRISQSNNFEFRNRTAIFSVFGATQARIYGYDSHKAGFYPSNQNAPAYTYIAESPCRNITCINKVLKTCKKVRCFENLDVKKIISDVRLYLESIEK